MAQQGRVIITDFLDVEPDIERNALRDLADVQALNALHEDELVGRIEDADAIMLYHNLELTRTTIDRLERCKLIVRCGVGVDNVDRARARERGIVVANVPDYGTEEVADTAIGMTLALTRGIHYLNSRLRAGRGLWSHTQVAPLQRLRGRVFGIVGLGRVGSAATLRAKTLGMDVVFHDPHKPDGYEKALGVRRVESLDELLEQAYVLSLHCDLNDQTRGTIGAAAIAKLQPRSYLINTARGAIVDTGAVPPAIASGQLAGAAIDVLPDEPPPDDDPMLLAWRDPDHPAHHRLIVNPHSAFYCDQGLMDIRVKASDACRRALLGMPVRNVVN